MNSEGTALDRSIAEDDASYFSRVVERGPYRVRILGPSGRVEFMNERGGRLFEIGDFAATFADESHEAVEALERQDFDLALMDMQMPVRDGLTATRLIRERERRTGARRAPIISVTTNVLPELVRASRDAGADLRLPRPLSVAGLLQAIQAVLICTVGAGQAVK